MRQTVTGLFETYDAARHAQEALLQRGFPASDIELPVHEAGVLAGIERLVASFFSSTGDVRANPGGTPDAAPQAGASPDAHAGNVLIGVRVSDEAHADLARDTLRDEHAIEVAIRGGNWTWAATEADPVAREHSALDELGLANLAEVMRRRVAQPAQDDETPQRPAPADEAARASAEASGQPARPVNEAEATVLASASAPGAGAVMGTAGGAARHTHVEVPGAPQATRPEAGAAPRIPDEFIEYEEDSHDHRASDAPDRPVSGPGPTLH
jgi:hypothetical protein